MSSQHTVTIKVRFRWWVRWYVHGLVITSIMTGMEPDLDKVSRTLDWMMRHGGVVMAMR